VLVENVLLAGFQAAIFSNGLLKICIINHILIRIITEIRIERKRKRLKLPRARFKLNIFRKEEPEDFVLKYPRFQKRKLKILSREISVPVLYQKELIFKPPLYGTGDQPLKIN